MFGGRVGGTECGYVDVGVTEAGPSLAAAATALLQAMLHSTLIQIEEENIWCLEYAPLSSTFTFQESILRHCHIII